MSGNSFDAFVLDQLQGLGHVEHRRMFGGAGLYCAGLFFGILYRDRLYLKTDEDSRAEYERRGQGPFRPNERQTLRSYYEVPPEVLEDADELNAWARAALEAARAG